MALKQRWSHDTEQRSRKRQTEEDLKTKKRRQGELTQSLFTREQRPRTVSKPSWSLQGSCGPLVHHNYWRTACQLRKETLSGASTETLLPAEGQEEAENTSLCSELSPWQQWCCPSWWGPIPPLGFLELFAEKKQKTMRYAYALAVWLHVNICSSVRSVGATIRERQPQQDQYWHWDPAKRCDGFAFHLQWKATAAPFRNHVQLAARARQGPFL